MLELHCHSIVNRVSLITKARQARNLQTPVVPVRSQESLGYNVTVFPALIFQCASHHVKRSIEALCCGLSQCSMLSQCWSERVPRVCFEPDMSLSFFEHLPFMVVTSRNCRLLSWYCQIRLARRH